MRAAIYVRVSTTQQIDRDSLKTQEERLRQYCKAHNFEIYKNKPSDSPHDKIVVEFAGKKKPVFITYPKVVNETLGVEQNFYVFMATLEHGDA